MATELRPPSTAELFENFCYMVVEEFLMKKGMKNTLFSFKNEWHRPNEEMSLLSWYEVALKLHLPELINNGLKNATVIENLVSALVQESSVKSRRAPDVTVSGLATMPRSSSLPTIVDNTVSSPHRRPPTANRHDTELKAAEEELQQIKTRMADKATPSKALIKRQFDQNEVKQYISSKHINNAKLMSNENWIPDDFRFKSLSRNLVAAKETFSDIQTLEYTQNREMKRLAISDLERAKNEESLQTTHKIPCSCCLKEFLYVNLPLKVSRKAIIDIRIKWSGKLSSSTVFGEIPQLDDFGEGGTANGSTIGGRRTGTIGGGRTRGLSRTTNTAVNANGGMGGAMPETGGQPSNLNMVPRCYDEVSVCVFCAQFFHIQEEYRPSFSTITYQERKTLHFDNKRREKEYWDPLEMIKKDRDAYEQSVAVHEALMSSTNLGGGGSMTGGIRSPQHSTANSVVADSKSK